MNSLTLWLNQKKIKEIKNCKCYPCGFCSNCGFKQATGHPCNGCKTRKLCGSFHSLPIESKLYNLGRKDGFMDCENYKRPSLLSQLLMFLSYNYKKGYLLSIKYWTESL